MPGKRVPFKDSKMVEFMQLLLEATREGKELSSKSLQAQFGFDKPKKWANFKRTVQLRIEGITEGAVTVKSRREMVAYYSLAGDTSLLALELELRTMSEEERAELLRWAIEEKRRREAEGEPK